MGGLFSRPKIVQPAPTSTAQTTTVSPPVRQTASDVLYADVEERRRQSKRRSVLSTISAGETLSGESYQSSFGTRKLLGG